MRRCIELAKLSSSPYGALIADPEQAVILAEGRNGAALNPIWHGEMAAIANLSALHPETSLYSIANGSSYAATTLHSVVIEEMLHMTMAANALNAIGGAPMIDAPGFVPTFPISLPMTNVSCSAKRFDLESVRNFMVVESITALKKSIGGAYDEGQG